MKKRLLFYCFIFLICFTACSNVKSQEDNIEKVKHQLSQKKEGNIIEFGEYQYYTEDNKTPEKMEWIVLENNKEDQYLVVITKYIYDAMRYCFDLPEDKYFYLHMSDEETSEFLYAYCLYENSDIRCWLNNDYLSSFSSDEQKMIIESEITLGDGEIINDKVYLLSKKELSNYSKIENFKTILRPTPYASSKGVRQYTKYKGSVWWLRDSQIKNSNINGYLYSFVGIVSAKDGKSSDLRLLPDIFEVCGIRPVIHISYK